MDRPPTATFEAQMIAGIFSTNENAVDAIVAERNSDDTEQAIHVICLRSDEQARKAFVHALIERIRCGTILIQRRDALNPAPVIEIFDDHELKYNPDANHDRVGS